MSRLVRRLGASLARIGFAAGRLAPLRRRVVLATNQADRLGGNLEAIRAAIARRHPDIPVVVLARRARGGAAGSLRRAIDLVVAGWHLATARVVIVDDRFVAMDAVARRPGTCYVQTWHACGAFKRFGYSLGDKAFGADAASLADVPIHRNYDVCLVSAMRFAPFYAEAFRLPPERFTSAPGIPRTDVLLDPDRRAAAEAAVRARYAIPAGRRVILYAPTFRGERTTDARFPVGLDVAALEAALGRDHVLLVRAHPFVDGPTVAAAKTADFVIDVSGHPELNELLLVSDVLVTDYSSAIYEFALLGRPIVFFMPDRASYDIERGFYLDIDHDLPGPVVTTTADLLTELLAGSHDIDRVRQFAAESFDVADGHASERFVDTIVVKALDRRTGG